MLERTLLPNLMGIKLGRLKVVLLYVIGNQRH